MTRQMLIGICVPSKGELKNRIYICKYFEEISAVPVPYKWKYKVDRIGGGRRKSGRKVFKGNIELRDCWQYNITVLRSVTKRISQ